MSTPNTIVIGYTTSYPGLLDCLRCREALGTRLLATLKALGTVVHGSHNLRKFLQIYAVSVGGGISHNEDALFSKVYCCLILNYPNPIKIWIWKLVVRALLLYKKLGSVLRKVERRYPPDSDFFSKHSSLVREQVEAMLKPYSSFSK